MTLYALLVVFDVADSTDGVVNKKGSWSQLTDSPTAAIALKERPPIDHKDMARHIIGSR